MATNPQSSGLQHAATDYIKQHNLGSLVARLNIYTVLCQAAVWETKSEQHPFQQTAEPWNYPLLG